MNEYTNRERFWLWSLAVFCFVVLNSVFLWGLLVQPELILQSLKNPISAVFIVESFLLMGVLSYLLTKWKKINLHWSWFIALSLIGSMGFALPVVLLYQKREKNSER